ncbi:hypothetical protein [Bacillus toyonensis]|uniref:hypothetical protein n=1 Tax=Bacillus toyonensis TaxID=155322 RepID=UPI00027BEA58|nr:hypothetical protein [Bacillus toyonensis]EJV41756.1 hypothetical protein IEA_05641 [Bacillus toyonensis]
MKAITKEKMLILIKNSFKDGQIIFEDDSKLKTMWKEYADEYFIEGNQWVLTNKSPKWKED